MISMLRKPSAFLPPLMSGLALVIVLVFLAHNGPTPQKDEGTAAHLWQFLLGGQAPLILFFFFKWLPESPKRGLAVVALQIGGAATALLPVFLLRW